MFLSLTPLQSRFNIELHPPTVQFLYLSKRHWVLASTWPNFTLAGQSIGSLVLGLDAFSLVVPDIFIDTMGYAFVLGLCKLLFPDVPTGAYVHYPTISTDMLDSLDPDSPLGSRGVNGGQGTGMRGLAKKLYWHAFALIYCLVGASIDVVMTNSTWTQAHIKSLWGPYRKQKDAKNPTTAVFPPVAVEELEGAVEVSAGSEKNKRQDVILYIAQFRPEKDHRLIVQSFYEFTKKKDKVSEKAKLVLVGSVRDDQDSKRVYELRLMANELGIKDRVEFHLDASWPEILDWLQKASIGVNGMWNEHFGIGVVEYQAAGLISVVHDSGGPKLDIVIPVDGEPTGKNFKLMITDKQLTYDRLSCYDSRRICSGLSQCTRSIGQAADATACAQVGQALHRGRVCQEVDRSDGTPGGDGEIDDLVVDTEWLG